MYMVTLRIEAKQLELIVESSSELSILANFLESAKKIIAFKVSNGSSMLLPHNFGWGDYSKWQLEIFPKTKCLININRDC